MPVAVAALFASGVVAVLKLLDYFVAGSPSMLSETYHSISDAGSQMFLLIGIRDSKRGETQSHLFDRGELQFFYSFLVSMMPLGIVGWESTKHGYDALMRSGHGGGGEAFTSLGFEIKPVPANTVTLLGAIAFESYAFLKTNAEPCQRIEEYEWSGFIEAFRETGGVTVLTVFTGDTVAPVGAVPTLAGISLIELIGSELFDAGAALLIGALLVGFVTVFAWGNKRLPIGGNVPVDEERAPRNTVKNDPRAAHINYFRASYVGPEKLLVALDVSFDLELDTEELNDHITEIEDKPKAIDNRVYLVYIEPEL